MAQSNSKSGGINLGGGIFLVFLFLKLAGIGQVANWSWWWVTSPLWITLLLALTVLTVAGIIAIIASYRDR